MIDDCRLLIEKSSNHQSTINNRYFVHHPLLQVVTFASASCNLLSVTGLLTRQSIHSGVSPEDLIMSPSFGRQDVAQAFLPALGY
jgi:hypothetical protein